MKRIAVFSDVHSNYPALESVLHDIENKGISETFCLGDLVGYGPYPNEVIEEIRKKSIPTLQGNYDEGVGNDRDSCGCAYITEEEKESGAISLEWTKKRTTRENKNFLKQLPFKSEVEIEGKKILLVHGSPRRNNEYLYEGRPESTLIRMIQPLDIDVMLMGHTHKPYHRVVNGVHLVNDGSVGKPKDGDPRASYVVLNIDEKVHAEFQKVNYPIRKVTSKMKEEGLPKYLIHALMHAGRE
jgi:putative phosphoesterase